MQLLGFLRHQPKKEAVREHLFALLISENSIQAAVWKASGDTVDIISKAIVSHHGGWENIIDAVDQALGDCTQSLAEGENITRVIFGLSPQYVQGEKIVPEYLKGLKKLCHELSLSPSGFVVVPEAIAYLLGKKEQSPPTVILVGVERLSLTVSLFKAGRMIRSVTVPRSEETPHDLEEALSSFSDIEILPSKILLYDGEKTIESVQQKLLNYPWEKKKAFLHFPKIGGLEKNTALEAVALAGAEELLIDTTPKLVVDEETGKTDQFVPAGSVITKETDGKKDKEKEIKKDRLRQTVEKVSDASKFGFVKDKDVAETETVRPREQAEKSERPRMKVVVTEERETVASGKKRFLPRLDLSFLSGWLGHKKMLLAILFFILFLTGGAVVYLYWTYPKATVTLLVDPQHLNRRITVVFNPASSQDNQIKGYIPAEIVRTEVSGSKTIATTGTKITGKPAKGEVTIYNKTTTEKTFPKGTVLKGPKKLAFTLDQQVTVASISDVIVGTPGKEVSPVTAVEIGSDSNLPAGSDFSFKDYPVTSYAARNEKAFSQGTSREVPVATKEDQNNLLQALVKELEDQALNQLQKKLEAEDSLLDDFTTTTVVEKSFSHDVGEETTELSLNTLVRIEGISYKRKNIIEAVKKEFNKIIPINYSFTGEEIEIDVVEASLTEEETVEAELEVTVSLSPSIDTESVRRALAGKTLEETKELLRTTKGLVGYEVSFTRKLPLGTRRLPYLTSNLEVEVKPR